MLARVVVSIWSPPRGVNHSREVPTDAYASLAFGIQYAGRGTCVSKR